MKSDLQKKWEKTYGKNPNPNENYFYNNSGRLNKNSKLRNILRGIGVIVLIIIMLFIKSQFKIYTTSSGATKIGLTNNMITQSNKNGKVMGTSITKSRQILSNTSKMLDDPNNNTINTLNDYITQVNELDLSTDYDNFKNTVINKIEAAIDCVNAKEINDKNINDIIEKYNSIDQIEELKKVFDKIGVKYSTGNNGIEYQYENK